MNALDLKNSILQLAIQGKLVEQREEEGSAKDLLEQIRAEKERLINEKKIKKEKPLPLITQDEIPFDIPESWEWVNLEQISSINGGFAFKSHNFSQEGVRVIRISDFNENGLVNNKIVRHLYDDSFENYMIENKNIILCMTGGTVGKSYFVTEINEPMITNQRVATIKVNPYVLPEYINFSILSGVVQRIIRSSKNSTNDNISMETIKRFPIALPPMEEQKRIVAKIEELMPFIDKYGESYLKLEALNKNFPEDMQKSILQYAIQGKLVEQRAEEGTAEDLYQQIQAEKARLIKEGKIKMDKPLPEITEDEIPFEIPESWKWVRLGDVSSKITDGEHKTPRRIEMFEGYYLLSARNVINKKIKLDDVDFVDEIEFNNISKRCNPKNGDILISCSGSVGRCCVVRDDNNYVMVRSAAMVSNIFCVSEYIMYSIQSGFVQKQIKELSKQTAQANLFLGAIKQLLIPLPPLNEQTRIVGRIEELLPHCLHLVK